MKSIFVSVVSYRDTYLTQTIQSLCENASGKYKIVVGIFDQDIKEKQFNYDSYFIEIRYMFIHHKYALGCSWARYMNLSQFENEDYYFSVDSHMLFDKDWDEKLLIQYEKLPTKSVMTALPYVCEADENDIMKTNMFGWKSSHITKFFLIDKIYNACAHAEYTEHLEIKQTQYLFGGHTLSTREWVKDVLCNHYLSQYWMAGEEMTMTMESFFKRWTLYTSEYPITAHLFHSTKKVWAYKNTQKQYSKSVVRGDTAWKNYLASKTEEELKAFHKYSGIDFINMRIDDWAAHVKWPFLNKPDDLKYPLDLKKQLEYESTLI
jgi:hypothetical protein